MKKNNLIHDLKPKGFKIIGSMKDSTFNERVSNQIAHEKELKERV
jgi:hypothetical protein